MILGIKELHRLVAEQKLVENLCEREMDNPEGAGFDFRMGEVFEMEGGGFLGVEERKTPEIKSLAKYDESKKESENYFVFEPGKYYLVKTLEKVNLPVTLSAMIVSRSTLYRSGVALFNGIANPGYSGEFTFGICNLGKENVKISLGARIAHVTFHEVFGEGNQYRGQWQGGRVSTGGKETQI